MVSIPSFIERLPAKPPFSCYTDTASLFATPSAIEFIYHELKPTFPLFGLATDISCNVEVLGIALFVILSSTYFLSVNYVSSVIANNVPYPVFLENYTG